MTRATLLAAAFAALATLSTTASSHTCLKMHVTPTMGYAPTKLWVYTRVQADQEHRAIEVIAESEEFYRSSEIQLDGADAPLTNVFEFRALPAGVYDIRAVLKGEGGRELETTEAEVRLFDSGRGDR